MKWLRLFIFFCIIQYAKSDYVELDYIDEFFNLKPLEIVEKICHSLILNETNICVDQLEQFCIGIAKKDMWALQMLDAIAKPQSGILYGNIMHVGNYDECLRVEKAVNGGHILGKYCQVQYTSNFDYSQFISRQLNSEEQQSVDSHFLENMRTSIGLCVPKDCTTDLLKHLYSKVKSYTNISFDLNFDERTCDWKGSKLEFTTKRIIGITVFGFFGTLAILSTLYDVFVYSKGKKDIIVLTAFSFYSNGKKLLSTKTSEDSLACLNGLKVISMMWVVLGHRYLYTIFVPLVNFIEYFEILDNFETMFVVATSMAVDSFFVISGLLLMYVYLRKKEKGEKITLASFYLHRFLRLTPSLAMVIVFIVTLMDDITSGPFWVAHEFFVTTCKKNWWSTLLYIQNYLNPNETCVGQSWYLAVDTQLYFIAPIIIFNIVQYPKCTILGMIFAGILSCGYNFELTWQNNYPASFIVIDTNLLEILYDPTHLRATPWLLGMISGYIIYKIKDKRIRIKKILLFPTWIFVLGAMIGIIFYHLRFVRSFIHVDYEVPLIETSLFNALGRSTWSLGLCFVIFLCTTGNGGPINTILSLPIFNMLNKINYSIYLLHLIVIMYFLGQRRTPDYVSNIVNFHAFLGDYFCVLIVSIIWTLLFESPIIIIEKFIFQRKRKNLYSINEKSNP